MDYINQSMEAPVTQPELPKVVSPTISSSAVLVTLSRSVPALKKIDKEVTDEVTTAKRASKNAGSFHKNLIECKAHDQLSTHSNDIYQYHARQTIVWMDKGPRLLPNEKLIDYRNTMDEYITEFDRLKETFLAEYPRAVANAQFHTGDMFKEEEYPSVDELRRKIRIRVSYEPIPDAGDFRIDIGNQAATEMQDTYNKLLDDRMNKAMGSVVERLIKPLTNMSAMLDYGEGDKKTGFRDTLVDNVTDIVSLLKTCNIANDPKITAIQTQLRQTLSGVTPDGLRHSPSLRAKTRQEVDAIINNLPSLGF